MSLSEETEGKIKKYFKKKQWEVEKLDANNIKAADFKVSRRDYSFLCEVKTIESDRAFNSHTASRNFQNYKKEILALRNDLQLKDLPFRIRIDCDDLYLPNREEIDVLILWLQEELANLHQARVSRVWRIDQLGFYTDYIFPNHAKKEKGRLLINVNKIPIVGKFSIEFYSYGGLNLMAIERNVKEGVTQLNASASREVNTKIPRVIVLRLASGIGFQLKELENEIQLLLKENTSLSAIALFDRVPILSKRATNFWETIINVLKAPWQIAFKVYHNREIKGAERVKRFVFDDGYSSQISV